MTESYQIQAALSHEASLTVESDSKKDAALTAEEELAKDQNIGEETTAGSEGDITIAAIPNPDSPEERHLSTLDIGAVIEHNGEYAVLTDYLRPEQYQEGGIWAATDPATGELKTMIEDGAVPHADPVSVPFHGFVGNLSDQ